MNDIAFSLVNTDTAAGTINLDINLTEAGSSTPLYTGGRSYYLLSGESTEDVITVEFPHTGTYILSISGARLSSPLTAQLEVVELKAIAAQLSISQPVDHLIPVQVTVQNSGYEAFSSRVEVTVSGTVFRVRPSSAWSMATTSA